VSAWELDDAERRNAEHPRRVFIPPAELRGSLSPGALVKLLFVGAAGTERMWVEVTDAREARYTGTLLNQPVKLEDLHEGEVIAFEPRHVAAYDYSADELGYERPDTIAELSLGYLTDLWPELAGPFRDGSDGEEWTWDEAAGVYRRAG
jgi:hypothetical protein